MSVAVPSCEFAVEIGDAWLDGRAFLFAGELWSGEFVGGEDVAFGGEAEEAAHAFDALFVEDVMDVVGEVGADGLLGDGELARPVLDESLDVLETVIAGVNEVFGDAFADWHCG